MPFDKAFASALCDRVNEPADLPIELAKSSVKAVAFGIRHCPRIHPIRLGAFGPAIDQLASLYASEFCP